MTADTALERLVAWGESEPSVRGLLLLGSRARASAPADEWSDTDLLVLTTDAERWLEDAAWVTTIGRPVVTFVEQTALAGLRERRVLLDDASDLDLVMVPVARINDVLDHAGALPTLARGYRVLLDKDRLLAELAARVAGVEPTAVHHAAPWPPPPDEVANLIGDFWYHAVWTTKKLRRGELATAVGCLNGHMSRILLRFVEWQAKARSGGAVDTWFDGRFLERWAVPETIERLGTTLARYDRRDAVARLIGAVELFGVIGREVAAAASVPYPDDAERWISAWVRDRLDEADA
jgi:aminoglycoside 6-adenylyltransferase